MSRARGFRAILRYRSDEFLSGGAGRQLLFLFVLTMAIVVIFTLLSLPLELPAGESAYDKLWYYFTRVLDAGTMGGDEGNTNRVTSTAATILGVIVAGLLISSLAGNFQERLDAIKRGGSPVVEDGHFLILGWSQKIFSVVDQLSEAYVHDGRIVVVVMAERDKVEMESDLRDRVTHLGRVKLVVRSGSSLSLADLSRVSFASARAIVVLLDEADTDTPNKADGRIIKTLLALYNHPDGKGRIADVRVTAEVMLAPNQEIASIASGGLAHVIKTTEVISKILLQTSRITGLSLVYDELLRFEGHEIHFKKMPVQGRAFGDVLLDFSNALVVGIAKSDGSGHTLNPPADRVIQDDEELLLLAEDARVRFQPYPGPLDPATIVIPTSASEKPVEHLLILGWNDKIFPILEEFDNYVAPASTVTLVNALPEETRVAELAKRCPSPNNISVRHIVGEFTDRATMDSVKPQKYPTVMVLGDTSSGCGAEESDTRAIIALLLLRDARQRAGVQEQEVCSEILDPKNRELAATTEINDIVISNEMISMVLAQVTYEPRIRPVLEDLFQADGSEIYLKNLALYAPQGEPTTFEYLVLAAKARGEVALGLQRHGVGSRFGLKLNPSLEDRRASFVPGPKDRLVVLAEDDA